MSSKHLRGDVNFAWPNAEIAVMGAGRARWRSSSARRRRIEVAGRARGRGKARFANPSWRAGPRGFIDDVIQPHETRKRICRSLVMLKDKKLDKPVAQARQHPP